VTGDNLAYSFFGIQVAFKNFHRDPLRHNLHELIAGGGRDARQSPLEKQGFWKRFTASVTEAMPVFEYGDWDLIRGGNAEETFNEWVSEIEGSLATEPEEVGAAADEAVRLGSAPSYVLATMMVLVDKGSNADETLGEWCDIPESQWLTRQTFARLVSVFPRLNFAYVQADAVYLVPGSDKDGLSAEDLVSADYHHLQPLT
jgi:hypothetical protein